MNNWKQRRILLLAAILLAGCVLIYWLNRADEPAVLELYFEDGNVTQTLSAWQAGDGICYYFLPSGYGEFFWKVEDGLTAYFDGKRVENGALTEFVPGREYTLSVKERMGFSQEYTAVFLQSENIPSVFLTTESGKMDYIWEDKNYKETGRIFMKDSAGKETLEGEFAVLKGRGNYTWLLDKKSYTLKFDQATNLQGLGADTEWVLMAGASEDTHLINRMVFEMMRAAGIEDVQNSAWVDLYLNGEYAGNYLLSQKVKPEDAYLTDSFMVEFDGYWKDEGGIGFDTLKGESLSVRYPKKAGTDTVEEIRKIVQAAEDSIFHIKSGGASHYSELVDMDSLVKKYVLDEISKCPDGWNGSNYCYYKDGKLYFGPPWDYEFAFGNQPYWFSAQKTPDGLYHKQETGWYGALYEDEAFYKKVTECYRDFFRPYLTAMSESGLDENAELIAASMEMDRLRWGREVKNFDKKLSDLKYYIKDRLAWLDEEWLKITQETEPVYYKLHLMNDGKEERTWYIREGSYVEADMLERDEDTFTGWFMDEACTVLADVTDSPVYQDVKLYAGWNRTLARAQMIARLLPLIIFLALFSLLFLACLTGIIKNRRRR